MRAEYTCARDVQQLRWLVWAVGGVLLDGMPRLQAKHLA